MISLRVRKAAGNIFFIVSCGSLWHAENESECIAEQLYAELMGWTEESE